MKINTFAVAALLFLPLSSFAAGSAWQYAAIEANESYVVDYKSDHNQAASGPVGFGLAREGDELIASVYYTEAGALRSYGYGCHSHGDHAHCHQESKGEHGNYARLTNKYKAEEMIKAIEAAMEMFVRKVALESAIKSMKIWEAEDIRFSINYDKNGPKQEFMACHYHSGTEMDCHRKGSAGPGEPDKK